MVCIWKRGLPHGSAGGISSTGCNRRTAEDRTVFTQLCAVHTRPKVPSCAEANRERSVVLRFDSQFFSSNPSDEAELANEYFSVLRT